MLINQSTLQAACARLMPIIPSRPALPELESILIANNQEGTRLRATNNTDHLEVFLPRPEPIGAIAKLLAKPVNPESFIIDASVLSKCAKAADADTNVEITADSITIQMEGSTSVIPCSQAEQFPDLPNFQSSPSVRLDSEVVARCLRCVSKDEGRVALQGVFWQGSAIVATDGRRMHMEKKQPECPAPEGLIIQTHIAKLLKGSMDIQINPTYYRASAQEAGLEVQITAKLSDLQYPNWVKILPEPSTNTMRFDPKAIQNAIEKLANTQAKEKEKVTPSVTLCPNGDSIILDMRGRTITIPAILTGKPQAISLNSQYLLDAIKCGGDTIQVDSDNTPAVVTGHRAMLHLIMPVRTSPVEAPKKVAV